MPQDRLSMRKMRDVLRYRHNTGLSLESIALWQRHQWLADMSSPTTPPGSLYRHGRMPLSGRLYSTTAPPRQQAAPDLPAEHWHHECAAVTQWCAGCDCDLWR